jgi:excisionase family DNA binding protein
MISQDYLSIKDFAKWIGVHPNTVRNMIRNKRIVAIKMGFGKTGAYRIAKSEMRRIAEVDLLDTIEKEVKKRVGK